jgi:hypothetical protein
MRHVFAHSLAIGSAVNRFQFIPPDFLRCGHHARSPYFTVSKVVKEVGVFFDGVVVMEGEELAGFKSHKPINYNFFWWGCSFNGLTVEEETVPAHAGYDSVDRSLIYFQVSGNLPVSHAADCLHEHILDQMWFLEPIGNAEGLGAEGTLARQAQVALYPSVVTLSHEGSIFLEGEATG